MNEADTRAELIDPKLKAAGWGVVEDSKILREHRITAGRIQANGTRGRADIADYVLVYKNQKIAVVEAKAEGDPASKGVGQAKDYAAKLDIDYTYATNGHDIYEISMGHGREGEVAQFPSPQQLWDLTFSDQNEWKNRFDAVPFQLIGGGNAPRYYQEVAVNRVLGAIAESQPRVLLTMATGTGKTNVAFQIAWKLFQTRWNLRRDGGRRPRILFLADRNILANQAFNSFSAFPEDALVRINPLDIRKKGAVPTNGSIFFTIFQTFMSGKNDEPYFGEYPPDFFDLVIIDECHRGGANDEGTWRAILEYFAPAVQLGLTATPKRQGNADTYKYFGEPVYTYSLKEGINDGFLTPFKVRRIKTTLDDYIYTSDDQVVEGEIEEGKVYTEPDFNRIIEIKEREAKRVRIVLDEIKQNEKTIIFCANQPHAAIIRDLVNQMADSKDPFYCVRVTSDDSLRGEELLRMFQDNERTIPTVLTTSQKLSTGVDARNVRNIVLMRQVNSMIEFKQIIGRGTRLFDGKAYFTIYDFVDAYYHFLDPEWDGEPVEPVTEPNQKQPREPKEPVPIVDPPEPGPKKEKIKIKLRDGKEREIQHMIATSFWSADGKPVSAHEFMENLYGALPDFFGTEEQLREIWANPNTRGALLEKLGGIGYTRDILEELQRLIGAEDSDLFDVLAYVSFVTAPISREQRVMLAQDDIYEGLNEKETEFVQFVLSKYAQDGEDELSEEMLAPLLTLMYHAIADAVDQLGGVDEIRTTFYGLQKHLYAKRENRKLTTK
jgi:type I restriction enzyme R subunit